MNSFSMLWEAALKKLDALYKGTMHYNGFTVYVRGLTPEFEHQGTLYFKVSMDMHKELVNDRFLSAITQAVNEAAFELTQTQRQYAVCVLTASEIDEQYAHTQQSEGVLPARMITLNPAYTFDSFVVGSSNKLANAASRAVANTPGVVYNPLFIYGGVGLGKTHLMHAIGNEVMRANPRANIIYITSESFTNELIESIQQGMMTRFRNKFRNVDVLMIDDIQFISRGPSTQEELFHTFNALYQAQKQIIMTSDKPPSEIPHLEERLLSRFQWGLLADIGLPDYETRVAILKNKAPAILLQARCSFTIQDEVMHYIAAKEDTNIRDLEGALKKVIAFAQLNNLETPVDQVDLSMASKALKDFFSEPVAKVITPKLVIRTVCNYFDVTEEDLIGEKKNREIAFPRQIAMYLLRSLTGLTHARIGELLGGKHYSTVMYADDKLAKLLKKDPELQNTVNDVIERIRE